MSTTWERVSRWGCLKGDLSYPSFFVVAAKRRVVPSISTWRRCALFTAAFARPVHAWTPSSMSSPCCHTWRTGTWGLSSVQPIGEGAGLLVVAEQVAAEVDAGDGGARGDHHLVLRVGGEVGAAQTMGCSVLGRHAEPLVRTQFPKQPSSLNFGANHLKKWIQHPQKPPIPFLSPHNPHHGGGFFWGGGQRVRAQ